MSLSIDDLTATCPHCHGTGQEPAKPTRPFAGIGYREIPVSGRCQHPACRAGKIPSASGRAVLEFVKDFARP